jgi:hypothetical protein
LTLVMSCPAVNSSGDLKSPCNGARGILPPLSFRRSAAEPRNLSSNGTRRNEAGDLSSQSLNSADTSLAIPTCSPARDDRAAGRVKDKAFPPYTRHPERQRRISVSMVSEGKGSQYQWAGRRVPGPGMTNTESFTTGTEILRLRLRMTGGAGRKHALTLAVSFPDVISSGALKSPRNGARGIPLPLSFRPKRSRVIIGKYRDSSPAAQNDRRGRKEDFRRAYHAKKR